MPRLRKITTGGMWIIAAITAIMWLIIICDGIVKLRAKAVTYEELIFDKLIEYRSNPTGFKTDILSLKPEYVWRKMCDVSNSIRDNQFTAVRAGHSVSKTFNLGRDIVWFKTCFQPSTIITTAPSDNQVKNQLWREVHAAYAGAKVPLGGKMTTLQWDVKPSPEVLASLAPELREPWEKNFAIGFSTSPDSATEHATKIAGWHNIWVLVVMDEACGIHPQIWRTAMEALIIDERCKVVAIGNPTDPECDFAKACFSSDPEKNEGNKTYTSDEGWNVVTISATDTPNYKQGKRVIPGLAGRAYVERMRKKYGSNGDGFRYRVLGLFPTHKEGTYYGAQLATAKKDGRVANYPHDTAAKVFTFTDTGDHWTGTLFAQFIRGRIRIIDDYWDNEGEGMPAWVKALQSKPYVYGGHWGGPELAYGMSGRFQTGKATVDIAAGLGIDLQSCPKHSFDDGIEAGKAVFSLLEINKNRAPTFIKAIAGYGKKKNMALSTDENTVYSAGEAKTWHRHLADAYRCLAMVYRYGEIEGEMLGYPGATPTRKSYREDRGVGDMLEVT